METRKKFGLSLIAVNITGLILAASFWLVGGILAGLIGFIIGLICSSALIYKYQSV